MAIDDSGAKDNVLKLVDIDNINQCSVRKNTTCSVLVVDIVVACCVLHVHEDLLGRM